MKGDVWLRDRGWSLAPPIHSNATTDADGRVVNRGRMPLATDAFWLKIGRGQRWHLERDGESACPARPPLGADYLAVRKGLPDPDTICPDCLKLWAAGERG